MTAVGHGHPRLEEPASSLTRMRGAPSRAAAVNQSRTLRYFVGSSPQDDRLAVVPDVAETLRRWLQRASRMSGGARGHVGGVDLHAEARRRGLDDQPAQVALGCRGRRGSRRRARRRAWRWGRRTTRWWGRRRCALAASRLGGHALVGVVDRRRARGEHDRRAGPAGVALDVLAPSLSVDVVVEPVELDRVDVPALEARARRAGVAGVGVAGAAELGAGVGLLVVFGGVTFGSFVAFGGRRRRRGRGRRRGRRSRRGRRLGHAACSPRAAWRRRR